MNTIIGGIYGLYRPECMYVLGDLAFGVTRDKMHRNICIGSFARRSHGKSRIYQGTFYSEAGMDFRYKCLLAQPFVGMELGYLYRDAFREHGADPVNLAFDKKNFFKAFSRLGVHFSTITQESLVQLNLDLAWLYRLSVAGRTNTEKFTDFGTRFKVRGLGEERSSLEAIVNAKAPLNDVFSVYAEATGQVWQRASTYSLLGGIQASW